MTATAMALLYGAGKKATDGGVSVRISVVHGIRLRRVLVLLLLIFCSPILIPFLFLASPPVVLFYLAPMCLRRPSSSQRLTRKDLILGAAAAVNADHSGALLHRYLEDQLGLARAVAFREELRAV